MGLNWSEAGSAVVGTVVGGVSTGFVAWALFASRLAVLTKSFSDNKVFVQNQHDQCRIGVQQDIEEVKKELRAHAVEKNHPPEMFRILLMDKLTGIESRLGSIEEFLRKTPKP